MGSLPDLPGDQTEQNSDAVEFVPPWQTLPDELLRDMFTEKGVDYAEPMPPRPVPSELTCPKEPSCTDLLSDPAGVLRDEKRWPNHLCEELFQRRSTLEWACASLVAPLTPELVQWRSEWPLPIGEEAVAFRLMHYNQELLGLAPFKEQEEALWAIRISRADSTIDLFGLGIPYGSGAQRTYGWGDLKYVLRGSGTQLFDLVTRADRWWRWFRSGKKTGRPANSGDWESGIELWIALRRVVHTLRAKGRKVTKENAAEEFGRDVRVLSRWLKQYNMKWKQIKKMP